MPNGEYAAKEMVEEAEKFEVQQYIENNEFIKNSQEALLEQFEDASDKESIKKSFELFARADVQDKKKENPEVTYHDAEHVISEARNGLEALRNVSKETGIEIPKNMEKIITVAALMHDMGYYEKDPNFGTNKIDHETRSQRFVEDHADELGLSPDEVKVAKIIIEGTRFATPLFNVRDLENPDQSRLTAEQQKSMLLKYGIEKDSLASLDDNERAALAGASILGTLDVMGADEDYIKHVAEGLQKEFSADKAILRGILAESGVDAKALDNVSFIKDFGEKMKKIEQVINETGEKAKAAGKEFDRARMLTAAKEYNNIPAAPTGEKQVKGTKFFYDFAMPARIAKTGLVEVEIVESDMQDDKGEKIKSLRFVPEGSLIGEKAAAEARRNQDAIYDYFEKDIKPESLG